MDLELAEQSPVAVLHPPYADAAPLDVKSYRELVVHPRGARQRAQLEDFVRREYLSHVQARVTQFMPLLLALHDSGGEVQAVVGCRGAAEEKLFLETYTREPIERLLARRLATRVARDEIVEIGSLACRGGRAAVHMVRALIPFLMDAGFSWVVFTGADTVKKVFRLMRLEPTVLCAADESALGEQRHDWGDYYRHHPEVMAGRLRDGAALLGLCPEVRA
jgi:hypothetical protein